MSYTATKEKYILVTQPTPPPEVNPPIWNIIVGSKYRLFFQDKAASASPLGMPNDKYIGWNDGTMVNVEVQDNAAGPGDGKIVAYLIEDTYIDSDYSSLNYSSTNSLSLYLLPSPSTRKQRIFVKCSPNKTLHLYCYTLVGTQRTIEVKEVNPTAYDATTLTWNNQPVSGDTIHTFISNGVGFWDEIPTGTTGAICIKYADESAPPASSIYVIWYSSDYSNVILRPYLT